MRIPRRAGGCGWRMCARSRARGWRVVLGAFACCCGRLGSFCASAVATAMFLVLQTFVKEKPGGYSVSSSIWYGMFNVTWIARGLFRRCRRRVVGGSLLLWWWEGMLLWARGRWEGGGREGDGICQGAESRWWYWCGA